jgi:hypothetical protein
LFPRYETIKLLLDLDAPTAEAVSEYLALNIGVIVTVEEDALLSKHGDKNDPWQRYRDAGVKWSAK